MIVATDGELLMRFVRHGDQNAFAEVVERHGRLVWMVCRQILRQHQDVEDAFQATFLILAQRAQAIRAADSAAAWLLKVAQRTALAARRKRTRRREESLAAEPPQGEGAFPVIHEREMRYALLDELRMLPARYQTPLIMRYLEGESRRAIAEQTDSTVGQVQGRLARGRRMLRSRLVRRGVSLSLAAGTIAGTSSQATAAVTSTLVAATAKSCLALKISGAAGSASPAALQLAQEGVKAMWWASIFKTTVAVTSALMVAAVVWAVPTGGGVAANEAAGPETPAGVALEANADQSVAAPETPPVAVASNPGEEVQWVANPLPPERQQLSNLIAQLTHALQAKTADKAEKMAQLELQQLETSLLQRELEHSHSTMLQLKSLQETDSEEAQQERERLFARIRDESEVTKEKLAEELLKTAKLAAELELMELDRTGLQRRLESMQAVRTQLDLPQQFGITAQGAGIAGPPPMAADPGAAGIAFGRMSGNDEPGSAAVPGDENATINPGDMIHIKALGVLPDQPINDVYTVDSKGIVDLGPTYGRLIVAGLRIDVAEEAIERHLKEKVTDPIVQVTMGLMGATHRPGTNALDSASRSTAQFGTAVLTDQQFRQAMVQQFEELQRTLNSLKVENARLKNQLEQLAPRSPR